MKLLSKEKKGLQQFVEKAAEDSELRGRLQRITDEYEGDKTDIAAVVSNTVIKVAKENGYEFSASEYIAYLKEEVEHRLACIAVSDDELFAVAGGVDNMEMSGSQTGGDVIIIDQHREVNNYNINFIFGNDTSPDTLRAFGQMLNGQ